MQSPSFPQTEKDDPTTVLSALEMGKRDWERGEHRDAVRWVHRAADAAEAAGNDTRALALARVAADMMTSLGVDLASAEDGDEAAALAPFDDFNDQTIVDSPAVMVARSTVQGPVSLSDHATPAIPPTWSLESDASVRSRTTLRVAVALESPRPGELNVMLLPEGVQAPTGTTEALLVLIDPNARLPTCVDRA